MSDPADIRFKDMVEMRRLEPAKTAPKPISPAPAKGMPHDEDTQKIFRLTIRSQ